MTQLPDKITLPEKLTEKQIEDLHSFYEIKTNKEKATIERITLDRLKITEVLKSLGYFRYDMPDQSSTYVFISDNRISLVPSEQIIIDAFEDYILRLPDRPFKVIGNENAISEYTITGRTIQEVLYRNLQSYFGSILGRLRPEAPIELLNDSNGKKYFFFANTAVICSPDGTQTIPYANLNGMIWQSNIIDRPFEYTTVKGDFESFIEDICGASETRKKSLMSILGYLMHDFYECDLRAVLFTDVNLDGDGGSAGGTGKGLLGKALAFMLNRTQNDAIYCAIPGKSLDLEKDTRYSLADATTHLIHLEDIGDRFNFKLLYNDVTDGATIRRPYQLRPIIRLIKIMISFNKTIKLKDTSDYRRAVIFELANYFSDKYRPSDKYKKRFFESSWNAQDWNSFFSFMCRSQVIYLKHGILEPEEINYSERTLAETVNENFRYWFADLIKEALAHKKRAVFEKNEIFHQFSAKYPEYSDKKHRTWFTKWCKIYCELKHIPFTTVRSTTDQFIIYPDKTDYAKA